MDRLVLFKKCLHGRKQLLRDPVDARVAVIVGAHILDIRQVGQGEDVDIFEIVRLQLGGKHVPEDPGVDEDADAGVCKLEGVFDVGELTDKAGADIIVLEIARQRAPAGGLARDLDEGRVFKKAQIGILGKFFRRDSAE